MARPHTPPETHSKRVNIMLTPSAIAKLSKLPLRQRSKFISDLITAWNPA